MDNLRTIHFSEKHSVSFKDEVAKDIDSDADFMEIYNRSRHYTMTHKTAMYALYKAMLYILKNKIDGAIVECGVWRGGSALLAALVLEKKGITEKDLYLYDTFEGMTEPTDVDVDENNDTAFDLIDTYKDENGWCYASLEDVETTFNKNEFQFHTHFIKGDVLETLPIMAPEKIALLRLDTDWYESTKAELEYLYPKLVQGGVLIIDDYGYWKGARKAVDEYFENRKSPLLIRINDAVRLAIKI